LTATVSDSDNSTANQFPWHDTSIEERYRPVPLLQDKVLVLSGVGPGLGRAIGAEAARMGADLVLVSRTERRLQRMAEVVEGHGRKALIVPTDITDENQRRALVDRSLEHFGRVDCLINNAFGIPPMDPISTLSIESLREANETNVFAPLRLSALFADALAESKGSIIMLNSCVQYSSEPEYSGYKLSKGTLAHLASSLATELGPRGIRVNSVAPSYIYEDVNKGYFDWLATEAGSTHEEIYRQKAAPTDLKRLASPEEVARAALFLASDLATAVTGTMLNVDCGEFHDN
jgi:NAD(P)-dependent dehydrogenase (short-subunit alcohol dehydrogenase family)